MHCSFLFAAGYLFDFNFDRAVIPLRSPENIKKIIWPDRQKDACGASQTHNLPFA